MTDMKIEKNVFNCTYCNGNGSCTNPNYFCTECIEDCYCEYRYKCINCVNRCEHWGATRVCYYVEDEFVI